SRRRPARRLPMCRPQGPGNDRDFHWLNSWEAATKISGTSPAPGCLLSTVTILTVDRRRGGNTMGRWQNLVLALVIAAPQVALAQAKGKPAKGAAPAGGDAGVVYKQKTVYDFDDDVVEGDLVRPDGEFVDSRRGGKISSLIKIRQHFIPEMLKSAEDI